MSRQQPRSGFSQRISAPIGGNRHTVGGTGVFEDLPLEAFNRRDHFVYFDDFTEPALDRWTEVDVGTQSLSTTTASIRGTDGTGVLYIDSDATDGDGIALIANHAAVKPAAGKVIGYDARVSHQDWDAHHWFVGLVEPLVGVIDADGDPLSNMEFVGFHHNDDDDADGIPRFIAAGANNTEITGTAVDGVTVTAGTDSSATGSNWRTFSLRIIGTDKILWYVDDVLAAHTTLASPFSAALTLAFGNVMNTTSGDRLLCDYVAAAQNYR